MGSLASSTGWCQIGTRIPSEANAAMDVTIQVGHRAVVHRQLALLAVGRADREHAADEVELDVERSVVVPQHRCGEPPRRERERDVPEVAHAWRAGELNLADDLRVP